LLPAQPRRIGRYEILVELGRGAMGVVYRARDPQIGRTVAIKTLRPDLGLPGDAFAELKKRFYQEATAAGRLSHPNIVAIHDVLDVDGVPYIVMECLEGRTLADLIAAEGRLDPARAVRLFVQVCEALDYAHARGVVHRDIKPGNIVVTPGDVAKVTDFGIARVTGSTVTQTGAVLGTPAYMAPEQLRGQVPDGRSDLFAVGVSLYEALAGANPFQADELAAILYRVVHEPAPPLAERNPRVSPRLAAAVERAMAKAPGARYATAGDQGAALAAAIAAQGAATVSLPGTTVSLPGIGRRRRRRRLVPAAVAAVALAAGSGWAAWSAWSWLNSEPPEIAASQPAPPPAAALGAIRVTTSPAVDILVDGDVRGRSDGEPVVIEDVPAGDRVVTLRLGTREHSLLASVQQGQTVAVSFSFPVPSGSSAEDLGRQTRETLDKLRGTADRIQRDAAQTLREMLDRAGGALDRAAGSGGGGQAAPKPEGR
jgi:serine/threonine protein kinase